jgi:hypothetical protein
MLAGFRPKYPKNRKRLLPYRRGASCTSLHYVDGLTCLLAGKRTPMLALNASPSLKAQKSLENASFSIIKLKNISQHTRPIVLLIKVQGVGFEPFTGLKPSHSFVFQKISSVYVEDIEVR